MFDFVPLKKNVRLCHILSQQERALLPSSQTSPPKPCAHSHSKALYPKLMHVPPLSQGKLEHGSGTIELKIMLLVIT